jgi:hypothetical protein
MAQRTSNTPGQSRAFLRFVQRMHLHCTQARMLYLFPDTVPAKAQRGSETRHQRLGIAFCAP